MSGADFQILKRSGFDVWGSDNYPIEFGKWTPTLKGGTTAGNLTYTAQAGWYCRKGREISIWLRIIVDQIIVPPSGRLEVGGLPFPMEMYNPSSYTYTFNISRAGAINAAYPQNGFMYGVDAILLTRDGDRYYINIDGIAAGFHLDGCGTYLTN